MIGGDQVLGTICASLFVPSVVQKDYVATADLKLVY